MEVRSDDAYSCHALKPADCQRGVSDFELATDEEIWMEFKDGNESAFEYMYTKYFPVLFNYGRQFTGDSELVKDVIQDLFIYLQEKRSGLADVSSIKFYLYKSYRNRIVRQLTRNSFSLSLSDYQEKNGFDIMLIDDHHAHSILDEELKQKMERAFTVLSKRQKEIVIYYFYEGFSYAQITSIMGFGKVEYTRILMSRTIIKLRKVLGVSTLAVIELLLSLQTTR